MPTLTCNQVNEKCMVSIEVLKLGKPPSDRLIGKDLDGEWLQLSTRVHTFWKAHLRELGCAVHAIFLTAVAVALCGEQVTAVPASQGHEPFMLKDLLLSHIDTAATPILQQCNAREVC